MASKNLVPATDAGGGFIPSRCNLGALVAQRPGMFDKAFSGPRRLTFDPRFDPEYLSTFQRSGPVESWQGLHPIDVDDDAFCEEVNISVYLRRRIDQLANNTLGLWLCHE
ncbi:hypothetical protein A7C99_5333 [Trichophyton rubrum]|uniref:Uncharacterized protein n=1 Tax=Trichophyton rubrum TaxID=5551 RepID=A0A178ESE2_TRIRU|nr:hypothetical protein A7C99_5333 [Trichophyton rubrum]